MLPYFFDEDCCGEGDREVARMHARLALDSTLDGGTPFLEALGRLALAQTAVSCGDRSEAITQLRQALCSARAMGSRLMLFHGGCLKAWLALKLGRQDRGLGDLRRALALGKLAETLWPDSEGDAAYQAALANVNACVPFWGERKRSCSPVAGSPWIPNTSGSMPGRSSA